MELCSKLWTFCQFCHGKSMVWSTNSSMVVPLDYAYEQVVVGCTKFIACCSNSITSIRFEFIVELVPTLLCSSWQNFD